MGVDVIAITFTIVRSLDLHRNRFEVILKRIGEREGDSGGVSGGGGESGSGSDRDRDGGSGGSGEGSYQSTCPIHCARMILPG